MRGGAPLVSTLEPPLAHSPFNEKRTPNTVMLMCRFLLFYECSPSAKARSNDIGDKEEQRGSSGNMTIFRVHNSFILHFDSYL